MSEINDQHWRKHTEFDDPEIWDLLDPGGFILGTVLTFGGRWAAYIGPVADYTMFDTKKAAMDWVLSSWRVQ